MVLALLAIDTETNGVGWHDDAFMVSIAYYKVQDPANGVHSIVWDFRPGAMDHDEEHSWDEILYYISDSDTIIMHNAKFDLQKLVRAGFPLRIFKDKVEDTQAIAHLIDEQQSTGLKFLAEKYLNETTDENEALKAYRRKAKLKKEDGYQHIPHEILAPYAEKDAEFTLRLYSHLKPMLHEDLLPLYNMEIELTFALLGIEARGMSVDREYVTQKRKEYGDRIYKLKHRIGELAGPEFNPQSPQQVLHALAERGVNVGKTDKATLSSLDDELARLIVDLREANKIKATYFDALHEEARDGILHPNFRQHGTRTGRMSSGSAEA
jgi:DNA polymerase-1